MENSKLSDKENVSTRSKRKYLAIVEENGSAQPVNNPVTSTKASRPPLINTTNNVQQQQTTSDKHGHTVQAKRLRRSLTRRVSIRSHHHAMMQAVVTSPKAPNSSSKVAVSNNKKSSSASSTKFAKIRHKLCDLFSSKAGKQAAASVSPYNLRSRKRAALGIGLLTNDALLHIFSQLSFVDKQCLRAVCKRFKELIDAYGKKDVVVFVNLNPPDDCANCFAGSNKQIMLAKKIQPLVDRQSTFFHHTQNLCIFINQGLRYKLLLYLKSFPELETLSISGSDFCLIGSTNSSLKKLRYLELKDGKFPRILSLCPNLQQLTCMNDMVYELKGPHFWLTELTIIKAIWLCHLSYLSTQFPCLASFTFTTKSLSTCLLNVLTKYASLKFASIKLETLFSPNNEQADMLTGDLFMLIEKMTLVVNDVQIPNVITEIRNLLMSGKIGLKLKMDHEEGLNVKPIVPLDFIGLKYSRATLKNFDWLSELKIINVIRRYANIQGLHLNIYVSSAILKTIASHCHLLRKLSIDFTGLSFNVAHRSMQYLDLGFLESLMLLETLKFSHVRFKQVDSLLVHVEKNQYLTHLTILTSSLDHQAFMKLGHRLVYNAIANEQLTYKVETSAHMEKWYFTALFDLNEQVFDIPKNLLFC